MLHKYNNEFGDDIMYGIHVCKYLYFITYGINNFLPPSFPSHLLVSDA